MVRGLPVRWALPNSFDCAHAFAVVIALLVSLTNEMIITIKRIAETIANNVKIRFIIFTPHF